MKRNNALNDSLIANDSPREVAGWATFGCSIRFPASPQQCQFALKLQLPPTNVG
jgi:hypothetical protein